MAAAAAAADKPVAWRDSAAEPWAECMAMVRMVASAMVGGGAAIAAVAAAETAAGAGALREKVAVEEVVAERAAVAMVEVGPVVAASEHDLEERGACLEAVA